MKARQVRLAIALLVVLSLIFTLYLGRPGAPEKAVAAEERQQNIIKVNGKGTVRVSPDIGYVEIGVEIRHPDAKVAQQQNAEIMNRVMEKLEALGIPKEDIRTLYYRLYPIEQYNRDTQKSERVYIAKNMVEVTVRDLDRLGVILDGVASVGSNNIEHVRFGIIDDKKYYKQALEMAIKDASDKAGTIARALGVSLKGPVHVEETSFSNTVVRASYWQKVEAAGVTPITPEDIEITATVSAEYSY